MVTDQQIITSLTTISGYDLEVLANNLLAQHAFPEITATFEPLGINLEKARTRKSPSRADTESIDGSYKAEVSVKEDWQDKLKEDIKKNVGRVSDTFIFFTNQDVGNKQIIVDGEQIDAEDYATLQLGCKKSFIIGRQALALLLQNPAFFYIRRNILQITGDLFVSIDQFKKIIRENTGLASSVEEEKIEEYAGVLFNELKFDSKRIVLLHNDDYITLLHTIAAWGVRFETKSDDKIIDQVLCFIRYPQYHNLEVISNNEINDAIQTVLFIWGADNIPNVSEYLRFYKKIPCSFSSVKQVSSKKLN